MKETGRGGKEEEKATEKADRVSGVGILACLFWTTLILRPCQPICRYSSSAQHQFLTPNLKLSKGLNFSKENI